MEDRTLITGQVSENGQIEIIDQDRLCFKVASRSKGAYGIRTISKDLLNEFFRLYIEKPNITANEARELLSGQSDIDKFEYGYASTLWQMAKMLYANSIKDNINRSTQKQHSEISIVRQIIYYGAPGTGKSHKIKKILGEYEECPKDKKVPETNIFRTTFHPDSDYSTFVGAYKPTMEKQMDRIYTKGELISKLTEMKDGGITYSPQKFGAKYWRSLKQLNLSDKKDILQACGMSDNYTVEFDKGMAVGEEYLVHSNDSRILYSFIPQAFLNAYMQAYRKPNENVYLIIEEINRGNCAQIFGDLFQLLDRNENGVSEYTTKADTDLKSFLEEELGEDNPGIKDGELCLPSNLYIYATMNTSDQSLFPVDSAFKRRWDWKYMPIAKGNDNGVELNWMIDIDGDKYDWWTFINTINKHVFDTTNSEDKQLGFFFCKAKNNIINAETFVGKVVFYLWNDVFKNFGFDAPIFADKEDETNPKLSFDKFYMANGEVNTEKIKMFLANLELEPADKSTNLIDSKIEIKVNGNIAKYINAIPYMAIDEYVRLNPHKTAQEVVDVWSPFKQYSMRSWIVCNKQGHDSMEAKYANYSYEIKCADGQFLWVNKAGWMHHPKNSDLRDTIAEFIEAVNGANLGITITETTI